MKTFCLCLALALLGCASTRPDPIGKATVTLTKTPLIQSPVPVPAPPKAVTPPAPTPAPSYRPVYFDFDRFNIREDQRATVAGYADMLKTDMGVSVTLSGHCDERGTIEYNLALGQRRAESVKAYLMTFGISPARLKTVSYGEGRPANSGHDEAAFAQNRRAEFTLAQ